MAKIGIADTTFSRYDMGGLAIKTIREQAPGIEIERTTVPGIKDLPVAAKKLIEEEKCTLVLCLGMAGKEQIDKQCSHEASLGIQQVQLLTNTHILEVVVHEEEGRDAKDLISIFEDRTIKHALNALELLKGKTALTPFAGKGRRQGREHAGPLDKEGGQLSIGIVVSDFNSELTHAMLEVAANVLKNHGCRIQAVHVPGAFEVPLACQRLVKQVDGIVTLAVVIQGKTDHDRIVGENAARKIADLAIAYGKPIGLGIVGPRITWELAVQRHKEYAQRAAEAVLIMLGDHSTHGYHPTHGAGSGAC
ncbi:MAG TPA: riboflavin synthase [Candidatus Nanoarchaeia archaeon]|nr:riboflavin synthase [Candidatus Nanoarchaeia archaeon]